VTRTQFVYALVVLAVAALLGALYLVYFGGSDASLSDPAPTYTITLQPRDMTLGSPHAPVQVVEYAAPTCPICARWDMTVFPAFKKEYVDTGKVYYIFRVFPLRALDAAVEAMARCLPKDSYFSFIDMMYRNQDKWDPDGNVIPDVHAALIQMGRVAGMTADKVNACISDQSALDEITKVGQYATVNYGIDSTPSFIIDGKFHQQDFMTPEAMRVPLNAELKQKSGS